MLVSDIQSIEPSNALGFGANTSLSICTAKRTLEVGDQKELVADGLLFVLQRWLGLRLARNDPSLPPSLTIPVIEMPHVLQREAYRYIEELSPKNYSDLMQEPPFLYSYTPETRAQVRAEFLALFETVFGTDPSKGEELLTSYILFHGVWTYEIVMVKTASGNFRRLCLDPEPLLNFMSDHFASVTKMDLTYFNEIRDIPAIAEKLRVLYEDYKFCLPQLVLPTFLSDRDQVIDLIKLFEQGMPGIQFQTPNATTSCKVLRDDGTYLLQLYSNPPEETPLPTSKPFSPLAQLTSATSSLSLTPTRSTVESGGLMPLSSDAPRTSSDAESQDGSVDISEKVEEAFESATKTEEAHQLEETFSHEDLATSGETPSAHPAEAHPPTIHAETIVLQQGLASSKPGDPVIHLI